MRCSRCHGLVVFDEWWSTNNDYRRVEGTRCVNCGNVASQMPVFVPVASTNYGRMMSHPLPPR